MTPAHHTPEPRWRILLFVVLVIAGVSVAVTARGTSAPTTAGAAPASLVGASDAESSAWYCAGQSTSAGVSPGFLVLTNTAARSVTATIASVTDSGATERTAVVVPARGVIVPPIPPMPSGAWEAHTVTVDGGGVAVSQAVASASGWSESPCQSTTASRWYFPGGTTSAGDTLSVSLLNPTVTPVVVDLAVITPTGALHPINLQGVVVPAGAVVDEDLDAVVQNTSTLSTIVSARTGRIVASEVQTFVGTSTGLAIVPGAVAPQAHWSIPQAMEVPSASSEIDVLNPGSTPSRVTVHLRLPSGALAPLTDTVAAGSTWVLATGAQTRIPAGVTYSADVTAEGGGVVVGRTVDLPGSAAAPQAGLALAVDGASQNSPTTSWVVPPPGTAATPAQAGVVPGSLALLNTSAADEHFEAYAVSSTGQRLLASGTLAPGAATSVTEGILITTTFDPIIVRAGGPMAVSEDLGPTGGMGIVTMPGLPLAATIGL
ncbi:MAG TPA: DUF5719 family protein [Acidimicrobiales bacterium]|nr:DUF5719 family protein [Acidimicrobiales bacterium]